MGYMDNKAAGRDKSNTATVEDLKASGKTSGNQEKNQPVPTRNISPDAAKHNSGNQVRIGANTKSTGQFKNPLNSYRKTVIGTAPDGSPRTGNKVAAKSK